MKKLPWVICAFFSLIMTGLLVWYLKPFAAAVRSDCFKALSDSFFVPAIVMIGVGLLVKVASTGFFDMLTYGFKNVIRLFTPFNKSVGNGGYYEYKVEMESKRSERISAWSPIVVGLCDLALSLVFLALYYL